MYNYGYAAKVLQKKLDKLSKKKPTDDNQRKMVSIAMALNVLADMQTAEQEDVGLD